MVFKVIKIIHFIYYLKKHQSWKIDRKLILLNTIWELGTVVTKFDKRVTQLSPYIFIL